MKKLLKSKTIKFHLPVFLVAIAITAQLIMAITYQIAEGYSDEGLVLPASTEIEATESKELAKVL